MPANNELDSMPILHPTCPMQSMLARMPSTLARIVPSRRGGAAARCDRVAGLPSARTNGWMGFTKDSTAKAAG